MKIWNRYFLLEYEKVIIEQYSITENLAEKNI